MATDSSIRPQGPTGPAVEEPTIGRLVADATRDVSSIMRNEIALAKTEVMGDVKKAGKGGGFFAAAAAFALLGLIFLLHTIAQALIAIGLAAWLSYLIVTLLLFAGAALFALLGKSAVSKIKGKPERTIQTTKETIDAVKASAAG